MSDSKTNEMSTSMKNMLYTIIVVLCTALLG